MVKNKLRLTMTSFFRKSIVQIITIFLLLILSSTLLNSFLNIIYDYEDNFDRTCEKLNSEDFVLVYNNYSLEDQKKSVEQTLGSIDYIEEYEVDNVIFGTGSSEFGEGIICNFISLISYDDVINKKVGKYEILDKVDKEGIIPSYLFKVSAGYEVGDKLKFHFNNEDFEYEIIGFYNNCTTGSSNCLDMSFILTNDLFNDVSTRNIQSLRLEICVDDNHKDTKYTSLIDEKIRENNPYISYVEASDIEHIKSSRYSNSTLFKTILSLGTIIMVFVLLIVIAISLKNYIQNSTKQLGTLKALGYTSFNLIFPIINALCLVSLIASVIGCFNSYFIFPFCNNALESQIGIPYNIHILIVPIFITISSILFITFITTYLSIRKIRKIAPINAIRDNKISSSKSNRIIKLEQTKMHLNFALGLKGFFSSITRNLVIIFAITCVSFLAGFGVWSYQNVIKDNSQVIELVCGQTADTTLTIQEEYEDELILKLQESDDVERFYLYTTRSLTPKDLPYINIFVINDYKDITSKEVLIDGNLPSNNTEVAINGLYASDNDLDIGDNITFEGKNGSLTLSICGLTQGAYYTGRDCFMYKDAFLSIEDMPVLSYYIDLKEDVDIDEFNNDIRLQVPILNYINQQKYLQSTANLYCEILNILVIVICLLSLSIIIFVLYILIYILLRNKRREHGILKSIGFTSNDIMKQTFLTVTPSCFIAIVLGLVLSKYLVSSLLSLGTSSIGILKFGTSAKNIYLALTGLFLILFVSFYTFLLSTSIKKIAPHDLFNNE